jgi:hypothetical protein
MGLNQLLLSTLFLLRQLKLAPTRPSTAQLTIFRVGSWPRVGRELAPNPMRQPITIYFHHTNSRPTPTPTNLEDPYCSSGTAAARRNPRQRRRGATQEE